MSDSFFPNDVHRPRYHFLPPRNWMNDPNGLAFINGTYHLFYQHNPHGPLWGSISWGHATSKALVHWEHLPLALVPDPDGVDRDGCYSGALVVHDGEPTIVYTGVRRPDELACLALSDDDRLERWTTYRGNPVIRSVPDDVATTIFRDHTLWREDDAWMMGIGSGIQGRGGAVLLFRSRDLRSWEYLHPLAVEDEMVDLQGDPVSLGWECPDFFLLDGTPVLVACDWDGNPLSVSYWTGHYEHQRFHASYRGIVDAGDSFYAPQSFRDDTGRRIMFGWMRERREDSAIVAAGWAGAMSLPRVVTQGPDGQVFFQPAEEVRSLRGTHRNQPLLDGPVATEGIRGESCELLLRTDHAPDSPIGLHLLRSPDGERRVEVLWHPSTRQLTLDTRQVSADPRVAGSVVGMTVEPGSEGLDLHVFVDRSVIEIYAGNGVCLSGRAYVESSCHSGIKVVNPTSVRGTLDLWDMTDVMP